MKHIILSAAAALLALSACTGGKFPADYVNPFIGASTSSDLAGIYHGLGKTFPGATTPWGMVQVSPNTITGGDNGPGYSYEHETLEGFAFTQMSGIGWYGDFGNFLVMPVTGEFFTTAGSPDGSVRGWRSHFDKETETASAGYYSAFLTDYGILAEATAAPHSGILQFTFPEGEESRIQIDLARRVGGSSTYQKVKVVDERTIEGWMHCPPEGGGWGHGAGKADYTVYFHARFSRPLTDYGFWSADIPTDMEFRHDEMTGPEFLSKVAESEIITDADSIEGTHIGFYTAFPTGKGEKVTLRVGISYVDIQGARNNLESEIADKSFDCVRREAYQLWNDALGRIEIKGGTDEEKTVFYTALYHTMIDPRIFSDADGRYVGGDGKIHTPDIDFTRRTIFSGWDVFRSQMPLSSLVCPELTRDLINTLINLAEESGKGYFERWEIVNAYSGCMVGNPALPVIADAYAKGIRDFDTEKALEIGEKTSAGSIDPELGYNPGSISTTLEDGYGDWCLGRFAELTGHPDKAAFYYGKSMAYRKIFDTEVKWFRPRNEDGSWEEWPENGRLEDDYGCVESNPYQQGWFVPHDIDGLVELLGGRETALKDLTAFFDATPDDFRWNSYYNHANEPVHHVPFLFNRLGAPLLTQKWTRKICANAYRNSVAGLVGNDDCGQMSAWYVLAACGIHPVCPGETTWEITSPVFDEVKIHFAEGNTDFVIRAEGNSPENIYIQSAQLNGKPLHRLQLEHADIVKGGELVLQMGAEPNLSNGWMLGPFTRPVTDAVIKPDTSAIFWCPMNKDSVRWRESDTFNPAATIRDGKICVLFRSEDNSATGVGSRCSRVGYAETVDGITMEIDPVPVLYPSDDEWSDLDNPGGIEDPRVAKTEDGLYVMFYTSWNHKIARLCSATSRDLKHWEKHGPVFKGQLGGMLDDEWSKSASIVTREDENGDLVIEKFNGKYLMYWGEDFINPATSEDLIHWTPMTDENGELLKAVLPRKGYFDSSLTECGPPAVHTEDGIVLIYNGKSRETGAYSAGQILFDAENPARVLARLDEPFFRPELPFEKTGQYVDGTVFCEGLVHYQGCWYLYYGCADSLVGVAVCADK